MLNRICVTVSIPVFGIMIGAIMKKLCDDIFYAVLMTFFIIGVIGLDFENFGLLVNLYFL